MSYMFTSKYTDNLIIRILYMISPFFTRLLIAFSDEFYTALIEGWTFKKTPKVGIHQLLESFFIIL